MATYRYTARNDSGAYIKGSMDATNVGEFYEKLGREGLLCVNYEEVKNLNISFGPKKDYKLTVKENVLLCRQLSTMLEAGMSITNSLDIICKTTERPALKQCFLEIFESVKGGKTLSEAMREKKGSFPAILVNMIQSGEESGNIDVMTDKLSSYFIKQNALEGKIKGATLYPKVLVVITAVVVVILFVFILPPIFASLGLSDDELPLITKLVIWLSGVLTDFWYIFLGLAIGGGFAYAKAMKIKAFRIKRDKFLIKAPGIGKLFKKIYSARFASTLAILYSSGLSLINGVKFSVSVISNAHIEDFFDTVIEQISVGKPLSTSIADTECFDILLPSMIKIGEETGSLDKTLLSISDYYDDETDSAIDTLLGIMTPLLIVIVAAVIATVMLAVLVPIFQSYGGMLES